MNSDIMKIRSYLTSRDILIQLAEECTELSQVILKLVRKVDGRNPTPRSIDEIMENIKEELTDVKICLDTIGDKYIDEFTYRSKLDRWVTRIEDEYSRRQLDMTATDTELALCRYCRSTAVQYVNKDRNVMGDEGFKSVCYCSLCHASVEAFDKDEAKAIQKAQGYWNRGILDAKK